MDDNKKALSEEELLDAIQREFDSTEDNYISDEESLPVDTAEEETLEEKLIPEQSVEFEQEQNKESKANSITSVDRTVISLALSLPVGALLGIVFNFTNSIPIMIGLCVVIGLLTGVTLDSVATKKKNAKKADNERETPTEESQETIE